MKDRPTTNINIEKFYFVVIVGDEMPEFNHAFLLVRSFSQKSVSDLIYSMLFDAIIDLHLG